MMKHYGIRRVGTSDTWMRDVNNMLFWSTSHAVAAAQLGASISLCAGEWEVAEFPMSEKAVPDFPPRFPPLIPPPVKLTQAADVPYPEREEIEYVISNLRARKIEDALRGYTRGPTDEEALAANLLERILRSTPPAVAEKPSDRQEDG